jgi:hypothetical protein
MKVGIAVGLSSLALMSVSATWADSGSKRLDADLIGYNEPPSVSTTGNGEFDARIDEERQEIVWRLSYGNLEGSVQQAHIHFAQRGVNGGITVFLCTNLGNGPAGQEGSQPCPPAPATVNGTIRPADVSPNIPATAAARTQGINTGEFAELVRAIRAGVTYVNVHSDKWPGGEIRDQIRSDRGRHHH